MRGELVGELVDGLQIQASALRTLAALYQLASLLRNARLV